MTTLTQGDKMLEIQVLLTPVHGEAAGQPLLLVDKYYKNQEIPTERTLSDPNIVRRKVKVYQPVLFPNLSAAETGVENFLGKLRQKKPDLRQFRIEYVHL